MGDDKPEMMAPAKEGTGYRRYHGLMAILIKVIGAGGCLFFLLYSAGLFGYIQLYLQRIQYNAIFMAVVLTLTFLLIPARKTSPRDKLPWYDILLLLGSLVGTIYIAVNALELVYFGKLWATPLELALGLVTMLALIEAVRRSFGWAMVAVVMVFLVYAKFGYLVSGELRAAYCDWSILIADFYLSPQGIFGPLTGISSGIIITFITFGVFFMAAGGGKFFLDIALAITGSMRGGPAKGAIVGSALFGTISGQTTANVVVTGSVTIPLMKSIGYKPYYAGAIETIASTGGAITPPIMAGIAFVMAEMVGVPYATIAMAAAVPAALYFLSLFIQVHLHAVKGGMRGLPREELPSLKATIKGGWEFIIPFLVLGWLLFVLYWPAQVCAVVTIVALIVTSMFRKEHRISFKKFVDSLEGGLHATLAVANIIALAGVIVAVLVVTGLGPRLSAGLVTIFGSNVFLLVAATGIATYVLGMGVSLMAVYILVSILVSPPLVQFGLPLMAIHFFIMYLVTSTLFTPPYCTTAYVAGAIAKAHPFRIGFQAMRLGIVCFLVPFVIVFNPALILIGAPAEIALAVVTAVVGIFGVSVGLEGYLFAGMNWLQRVLFLIGGLAVFVPDVTTDLIGVGILALAVFWHWWSSRRATVAMPVTAGLSGSSDKHK